MQFTRTDIPSTIQQAHRALYLIGAALANGYAGDFYCDVDNQASPLCTMHPFIDGTGKPRLTLLAAFELKPDYLGISSFDWEKLKDPIAPMPFTTFSTTTINMSDLKNQLLSEIPPLVLDRFMTENIPSIQQDLETYIDGKIQDAISNLGNGSSGDMTQIRDSLLIDDATDPENFLVRLKAALLGDYTFVNPIKQDTLNLIMGDPEIATAIFDLLDGEQLVNRINEGTYTPAQKALFRSRFGIV